MHYFKVLFIKPMKGKKTDRKSANFKFLIKKNRFMMKTYVLLHLPNRLCSIIFKKKTRYNYCKM